MVSEKPLENHPIDGSTLTVYTHQVGGHQILVKPKDSSIILKPYDEAEYKFYDECVPQICASLSPFTARCFGEVDLKKDNSEHVIASSKETSGKAGKYVMLEDLAHGITKPCILDLKMGLKQRSIQNYSLKKVHSKERKSNLTTSHLVGFRLGGAQLYSDGNIVFYNKYFGRLQDVSGTLDILKSFFDSVADISLSKMIIETFIDKLNILRDIIRSLPGFRFWSGSLLFIFDSTISSSSKAAESVILKMIDFANYTRLENNYEFDREYVYGIDCIILFLRGILLDQSIEMIMKELPVAPNRGHQDAELAQAVEYYRQNSPNV